MHGPECVVCDKFRDVNEEGWCDVCVTEFEEVLKKLKCARSGGVCESKLFCWSQKRCSQAKAALIVHGEVCDPPL